MSSKEAQDDGTHQLLRGSRRLGLQAFRRVWSLEPTFRNAFLVAQLARVAGNEPLRTEVLQSMQRTAATQTGPQKPSEQTRAAAGLAVLELLRSGDASSKALRNIDALLLQADMTTRGECAYVVGQELAALGRTAEAELYWRRAGESGE